MRLADGRDVPADAVAVAAGAVGSPALLRASGRRRRRATPRNHDGLAVTLRLRPDVDADVHGLVTGAVLRRDGVEVTAMNHLGPDTPGHGMLLAVALVPGALAGAGALVAELLATPAFAAIVDDVVVDDGPAGVHHLTSTLPMGDVRRRRRAASPASRTCTSSTRPCSRTCRGRARTCRRWCWRSAWPPGSPAAAVAT